MPTSNTNTRSLNPVPTTRRVRRGGAPPPSDWEELKTDEGEVYYYNKKTDKTQWEKPPGFRPGGGKKKKKNLRLDVGVNKSVLPDMDPVRMVTAIEDEVCHHAWKAMKTADGIEYYYNTETDKTQWEKPEELKTDADQEREGEWYWVEDKIEAFVPARKEGEVAGGKWELSTDSGQLVTVPKLKVAKLDRLLWMQLRRTQADLVMLDVMNRPLILYNLRERFKANKIYTNVGTILISINPYKRLPLYTPAVMEEYIKRGNRRLAPHVFEIADNAYRQLRERQKSQSIVISGESGAGKTECTKQCLQYLAEIAGSIANNVEQRILMANPILEAFGNAKTVRNNNSSRFGKYVEIFFDRRSAICGAQNTNYLLEKCRVVSQNSGERNFHAFYQLVQGADDKMRKRLLLEDVESYYYLNQSGSCYIDGVDDRDEYKEVMDSMQQLDFKDQEIDDIWSIIAGILALGNVQFESTGDRASKVSSNTQKYLQNASTLFQVPGKGLADVLTTKILRTRGQDPITTGLSVKQAVAARDALAKFIYEKLFDWLVIRINKSIGRGSGSKNYSIGILDIFGFEIFEDNNFEQLCINYTNEKLQQFFNAHTFKLEEALYKSERIKFGHVKYVDNQPVLDLIEKSPNGIMSMINEELRVPRGSDKTFVDKLKQRFARNDQFKAVLRNPDEFVVKHYAGEVKYDSRGFLEKNRDRLNEDAYSLLQKAKFRFLASLFPQQQESKSGLGKKASLGTKFRKQLDALMSTLNSTEPHYIRCVKPNPNKAPMEFVGHMCNEQLQYAGVFEAVQIRKQGYPFRYTHEEFYKRYKCIMPPDYNWSRHRTNVDKCKFLIEEMKQDMSQVQIGTTRILYRADQHKAMELHRNLAVEQVTVYIQRHLRRRAAALLEDKCRQVQPKIAAVLKTRDLDKVEAVLKKLAADVPFELYEIRQAKRIKFIFEEEKRLEKVFKVLLQQDAQEYFEEFEAAVESADDIDLRNNTANEVRARYQEALAVRQQIDADAVAVLELLDDDQLKNVLERADAIGHSSPDVEEVRALLYDTAKDEFVKLQLKAAMKYKDEERIIARSIKLKDMVFEESGSMYRVSKCSKVLSAEEWAGKKLLGFLNREKLEASMFRHQTGTIHHSLTDFGINKPLRKQAQKMFKNILGYMGDKKYESPNILASQMLQFGLSNPLARDELYCQIIKQLMQNPNPQSSAAGWALMMLTLSTFPPSPTFANHLEYWLRKTAKPEYMKYVHRMYQTTYRGGRPSAPQPHELDGILNEQKQPAPQRARGYSNAPTSSTTSFHPSSQSMGGGSNPMMMGGRGPGVVGGGMMGGGAPRQPMAPSKPPGPAPSMRAPAPKPAIPEVKKVPAPGGEWYYVTTSGEQLGPCGSTEIKMAWSQGNVNGDCECWESNFPDWVAIKDCADLMAYLQS